MFTSYFVMHGTADRHLSFSVFNFFLVLLSDPVAMSCNVLQSSDNTAFKQSNKFWESMNTLSVFTSSASNSKRSALVLSHVYSSSVLAVFLPDCLFIVFWLAKIGKVFKLSLIWCAGQDWEPETVLLLAILVHE